VPPNDALSAYFRSLGKVPLLDAAAEKSIALLLRESEVEAWYKALQAPPIELRLVVWPEHNLRRDLDRVLKSKKAGTSARFAEKIQRLDLDRKMVVGLKGILPARHRARVALARADKYLNHFVLANLKLVVGYAKRMAHGGVELEELLQEGNQGLMIAVHRYDPDRGWRFSTYAQWWISHYIRRYIQNKHRLIRVPVWRQESQAKVRRIEASAESWGEDLSEGQLARRIGMKMKRVQQLGRAPNFVSMDAPMPGTEGPGDVSLEDVLPSENPEPGSVISAGRGEARVLELLTKLPSREVFILQHRYGFLGDDEKTLEEIGVLLGITRERVRQLEAMALNRLRVLLHGEELEKTT
jgi:RNA polymerase primary sigma factor